MPNHTSTAKTMVTTDRETAPPSTYMTAYTAARQDEAVLLEGRECVSVPPPTIIPGDLVRDEARLKEVEQVVPPSGREGTFVYFMEGTRGFRRLEYSSSQKATVWRWASELADEAG